MINIDELKIGDYVYSYSSGLGIFSEFEYLGESKFKLGSQYYFTKDDLKLDTLFTTKDAALVNSYINALSCADIKINHHIEQVKKCKLEKEQLNQEFGYLKEKYPEMFI